MQEQIVREYPLFVADAADLAAPVLTIISIQKGKDRKKNA